MALIDQKFRFGGKLLETLPKVSGTRIPISHGIHELNALRPIFESLKVWSKVWSKFETFDQTLPKLSPNSAQTFKLWANFHQTLPKLSNFGQTLPNGNFPRPNFGQSLKLSTKLSPKVWKVLKLSETLPPEYSKSTQV